MSYLWVLATMVATIVYFALSGLAQSLLYVVVSVLTAIVVLVGTGRRSDAQLGWRLMGWGWLVSACGNAMWTWFEFVTHTAPFPSLADVIYLSAYVLLAAGLLALARAVGRHDTGALLDAVVVAVGAGVLAWVTLITPYASDSSLSLVARIVSIAYPASDLLLLTLLLRLLFTGPTRRHPALMLLATSFAVTLATNVGFGWTSLQGTYASGHWIDAGWLLGFMLGGVAALHPSANTITAVDNEAPRPVLPRSRLVVLGAASLVAPALVVSGGSRHADLDLMVVGTASAVLFVLVLWRMAGLVRQISLQAAELDALSTTDPLTGVANRRRWDAELQTAVARTRRSGQPLTIALLDIDRFKAFNDTYGHPSGDKLLTQTAMAWQHQLRPGDLLARIGGEEFAVLLAGCQDAEAYAVVERMRAATPGDETCSAGIATLDTTDTYTDVIDRADHALYQAKRAGRNRTMIAPPTTTISAT
jgi:diguanylate cyclase (GGDEF)-like protein